MRSKLNVKLVLPVKVVDRGPDQCRELSRGANEVAVSSFLVVCYLAGNRTAGRNKQNSVWIMHRYVLLIPFRVTLGTAARPACRACSRSKEYCSYYGS